MLKYILYILSALFFSCNNSDRTFLPFDFQHPEEIKLPERLHEISGITLYHKNEVACIQDEKGIIFFYDIKKDKLRSTVTFASNKDFEGIADVNDTLFVLCSNGIISEIEFQSDTNISTTYSTFLSKNNNCEGLCYDERFRRLLVACKGKPEKGTAPKSMKAIYSFDLHSKKLIEAPAFIINPDSVQKHFVNHETSIFRELFTKKEVPFLFEPSDIGIDPLSNDIYILSSVGNTLLDISYEGKIKFAIHLDPAVFKQPEGITFAQDGSMLISDEGRNGKANIIKIHRQEV